MLSFHKGLLFFLLFVFGLKIQAQQNYFNVPSGEITEKNKLFFQYQLNAKNQFYQNNITLDYGLGHHFEVGVNFYDVNFNPSGFPALVKNNVPSEPLAPLVLVNAQKALVLGRWSVSAGIQAGTNSFTQINPAYWSYGLIRRRYRRSKSVATLGLYNGNKNYLGMGSKSGIMAGLDRPLYVYKKHYTINLNADFIAGSNGISVAVPGLVFAKKDKIMLSVGGQIPVAKRNGFAAVFEFTWHP